MAYIIYTDEAYKRDFYHYLLRGHYEGIGIVVDKGFEWKEEEGGVKSISVRYPINPYWYELGNKPDYLSSRKIYYYRAWLTYWLEGPEETVYGEWVQFTSINPMCTGFTNFEAKRMMKKYYSYHGEIMPCKIQPDPEPFVCEPEAPTGPFWVLEYHVVFGAIGLTSWKRFYTTANFLFSSDPDPCIKKWPSGTKLYYAAELYIAEGYTYYAYSWNKGSICGYTPTYWLDNPGPYYSLDWVWADTNRIVGAYNAGPGSYVKVWRSSNGELPSGSPF